MTRHTKTAPFHLKATDDDEGIIERVVSVFGNVDYAGDRVQVGAFADTIEAWKASGDPIPVVFSHDWSNLDAHLGVVEDIKELPPGDPLLPAEIADNGGLWVREKYDLHVPAAARAFELQKRRSLKESSFAYTTNVERKARDGANELVSVNLIEVGPCLKGMNPATQLLAAKSIDPDVDPDVDPPEHRSPAHVDHVHHDGDQVLEVDPDSEVEGKADTVTVGAKAFVVLEGSYEKLIDDLAAALPDWTVLNFPNEDWWYVGVEATYPDTVVIYMETWADPPGKGNYQQASYARQDDGSLLIEAPRLVAISGNVVPKALRLAGEKLAGKAERTTAPADVAPGGLAPSSVLAVLDLELEFAGPTAPTGEEAR